MAATKDTESEGVLRGEPGCDYGCPNCTIRCAVVAGCCEDAWEEVDRLRTQGGDLQNLMDTLERAEAAERAFERIRPRQPDELPIPMVPAHSWLSFSTH